MQNAPQEWLMPAAAIILVSAGGISALTIEEERVFVFKEPRLVRYVMDSVVPQAFAGDPKTEWLPTEVDGQPGLTWFFGSRVILGVKEGVAPGPLLKDRPLEMDREFAPDLFVIQAPNPWIALREAAELCNHPEVKICHPVRKRPMRKNGKLAPRPNDPMFPGQWHLDNRDPETGAAVGPDLNIRAAWSVTRGEGVVMAIVDDGIELNHPEFEGQSELEAHYNFILNKDNGLPRHESQAHGTIIAGLAGARADNELGLAGAAPAAKLASWVVWDINDSFGSEEQVADMFQYMTNRVAVQNHSWGSADSKILRVPAIEMAAIDNAIENGRDGKGVVMVRVTGNSREEHWNSNDDGYANDPRIVLVGAVRSDGRVARFSNPGACVLCTSFAADQPGPWKSIYSTDRLGLLGWNTTPTGGNHNDYVEVDSGTSFAAPQITGIVGLILSVNPSLSYRDVQQILIHASRHFDLHDPTLEFSGAGYLFSHNTGFGVPDAGVAVELALDWKNRPPVEVRTFNGSNLSNIPDDGVQLELERIGAVIDLSPIKASPGDGLQPDEPTSSVPIIYVGLANEPLGIDLTGKAALILRGGSYFNEKINHAAAAGAEFAIVYNNRDGDDRIFMVEMDFARIPAVFISQNDGKAIQELLDNDTRELKGRLYLNSAEVTIPVDTPMICEHVGLKVKITHPLRSDLRLTLKSPTGTISILQATPPDNSPWSEDWTYWTAHHFYESSLGTWTVSITDQSEGFHGAVESAELVIRGVKIIDVDGDGLHDGWEEKHFKSIDYGAIDDNDMDGQQNAREQALDRNPNSGDARFAVNISVMDDRSIRMSWPGWPRTVFSVQSAGTPNGPWEEVAKLPGSLPETEWVFPIKTEASRFFRIQAHLP